MKLRNLARLLPFTVAAVALAAASATAAPSGAVASGNLTAVTTSLPTDGQINFLSGGTSTSQTANVMDSTLFETRQPKPNADQWPPFTVVTDNLASSEKVDPGGSGITVTLRHTKSNYGNLLTCADVAWSLRWALANDPISVNILKTYAAINPANPVTALSSTTCKINTLYRSVAINAALASPIFAPIQDATEIQKHATASDPWAKQWLATNSAVFGPFYMTSVTSGQRMTFQKNPGYWDAKNVKLNTISMQAVPDPSTEFLTLKAGQADVAIGLTYQQFGQAARTKNLVVPNVPNLGNDQIAFNLRSEPWSDIRVREALSLAINRTQLVSGVYGGYGVPGVWAVPSNYNQPKPTGLKPYNATANDVAAKALLAQAGYPNGVSFTLLVSSGRVGAYADQLAQLLQSQLAAAGFNLTIQDEPSAAGFQALIAAGKFEVTLYPTVGALLDIGALSSYYLNPGGTVGPWTGVHNSVLQTIFSTEIFAFGPGARRNRIISYIQKQTQTSYDYIPLVQAPLDVVWSSKVKNLLLTPGLNGPLYRYASVG